MPATAAGVGAIEELTARGVNVNVTLLFSVERYEEVIEAYLRGLERRVAAGEPIDGISSVASFFVSRVDAKADAALAGRLVAARPGGDRQRPRRLRALPGPLRRASAGTALEARGARPQRPLWASTGTKDPSYSDVLYVEKLIAPGVINTMPEQTLRAFADHGNVEHALDADPDAAQATLSAAAEEGVDLTDDHWRAGARGRKGLLRLLRAAARLHRIQARLTDGHVVGGRPFIAGVRQARAGDVKHG